eukprot:gene3294-6527_t
MHIRIITFAILLNASFGVPYQKIHKLKTTEIDLLGKESTQLFNSRLNNAFDFTPIALTSSLFSSSLEESSEAQEVTRMLNTLISSFRGMKLPLQVLVGVNIVVYLAWIFLPSRVMLENATASSENNRKRRWWTWITANFSHMSLYHLAGNVASLTLFGPPALSVLGLRRFCEVIFLSAISSSLFGHLSSKYCLLFLPAHARIEYKSRPSLGFSGINAALFVFYVLARPNDLLSIMGATSPIPARKALRNLMIFDIIGLICTSTVSPSPIGHGAHLGGFAFALLYRKYLCSTVGKGLLHWRRRNLLCDFKL